MLKCIVLHLGARIWKCCFKEALSKISKLSINLCVVINQYLGIEVAEEAWSLKSVFIVQTNFSSSILNIGSLCLRSDLSLIKHLFSSIRISIVIENWNDNRSRLDCNISPVLIVFWWPSSKICTLRQLCAKPHCYLANWH